MVPPSLTDASSIIVIDDDSDGDLPIPARQRGRYADNGTPFNNAWNNTWPTDFTRNDRRPGDLGAAEAPALPRAFNDGLDHRTWNPPRRSQSLFIDLSESEVEDVPRRPAQVEVPDVVEVLDAATPEAFVTDPTILYQEFEERVQTVFPEICPKYLRQIYDARSQAFGQPRSSAPEDDMSAGIILYIAEMKDYPKREKPKQNIKKRKRAGEESSDEEAKEWTAPGRFGLGKAELLKASQAIKQDFPSMPHDYIKRQLRDNRTLYAAYRAVEAADRSSSEAADPAFKRLKNPRKQSLGDFGEFVDLKRELEAVRRRRTKEEATRLKKKLDTEAEEARDKKAFEDGDVMDCQCCFVETPSAKLTHCDADEPHFFCLDCAKSNAKSQIDYQRYKLKCMDGSGCQSEFPQRERPRFLDEDMISLLDRLQQQTELREAELENLEHCPFCDFAAICPPKEVDKEFRCQKEDCGVVSCRLCQQVTHIPKTCAEHKREQGVDERHIVEESMTEALLRRCPKCKVPIIKDGGCNKLICSQCHCYVCDVCGKDITKDGYNHFSRGTCPQVDDFSDRDQKRIEEAERKAREKVRTEHPELSEEDLKIKFSDAVKTTAATNPNPYAPHRPMPHAYRPRDHQRHADAMMAFQNQLQVQRNINNNNNNAGAAPGPAVQGPAAMAQLAPQAYHYHRAPFGYDFGPFPGHNGPQDPFQQNAYQGYNGVYFPAPMLGPQAPLHDFDDWLAPPELPAPGLPPGIIDLGAAHNANANANPNANGNGNANAAPPPPPGAAVPNAPQAPAQAQPQVLNHRMQERQRRMEFDAVRRRRLEAFQRLREERRHALQQQARLQQELRAGPPPQA